MWRWHWPLCALAVSRVDAFARERFADADARTAAPVDASFTAMYTITHGPNDPPCRMAKLALQWDGDVIGSGSYVGAGCSANFASVTPPVGFDKPGAHSVVRYP